MWRVLSLALMMGVAAWGITDSARAQTAQPAPKAAPKAVAPAANSAAKTAAKPESKPASPAAAVAGGAEPTLIGQFGTWGAYSATPNGKKVCFALAKPSSSKTNPPNRPRDPRADPLTAFPNWTFPAIPAAGTKRGRAIFQSQY